MEKLIMKLTKLALLLAFASTQLPIFGMFLDPVLKNGKEDIVQPIEYEQDEEEYTEILPDISNKTCKLCSQSFEGLRNYNEFAACNACAHTECLQKELKKRSDSQNLWRFCMLCDSDYTQKQHAHHIKDVPIFIQNTVKEKLKQEQQEYDQKLLTNNLPSKFLMTTLLTFIMIYSHKKLNWSIDFCNSICAFVDSYYGLSSAQLHTSSDTKIKILGKVLYVLANQLIPAYTLYQSLNTKLLSNAVVTSVKINQPNKITNLNFIKKDSKEIRCPYDQPLLEYLWYERNKHE